MNKNDKLKFVAIIVVLAMVSVSIGISLALGADGSDHDDIGAMQLEEAIRLEKEDREQQRIDNVLRERHNVIAHAVGG